MKFGIIAEGWSDVAVLENIMIGLELIDNLEDVLPIRPERNVDESDLSTMRAADFSNWTLVKKECVDRINIQDFLLDGNVLKEERKMIVHIDTAECGEIGYEVDRPIKDKNYCLGLRNNVIEKIKEWLDDEYIDDMYFAVAIEETEAWIHALYETKDTSKSASPKETFRRYLSKNKITVKSNNAFQRAKMLSDNFTKINNKKVKGCLENNLSLKLFVNSLPVSKHI